MNSSFPWSLKLAMFRKKVSRFIEELEQVDVHYLKNVGTECRH